MPVSSLLAWKAFLLQSSPQPSPPGSPLKLFCCKICLRAYHLGGGSFSLFLITAGSPPPPLAVSPWAPSPCLGQRCWHAPSVHPTTGSRSTTGPSEETCAIRLLHVRLLLAPCSSSSCVSCLEWHHRPSSAQNQSTQTTSWIPSLGSSPVPISCKVLEVQTLKLFADLALPLYPHHSCSSRGSQPPLLGLVLCFFSHLPAP